MVIGEEVAPPQDLAIGRCWDAHGLRLDLGQSSFVYHVAVMLEAAVDAGEPDGAESSIALLDEHGRVAKISSERVRVIDPAQVHEAVYPRTHCPLRHRVFAVSEVERIVAAQGRSRLGELQELLCVHAHQPLPPGTASEVH